MTATAIPRFLQLPYQDSPVGLDIGLIGLPWDCGTTSSGRARQGPVEIRRAGLGWKRRFHPTLQRSPLDLCRVGDLGDLELSPFDREAALTDIEACIDRFVEHRTLLIALGGDHLVTLPILRALGRAHPLGLVLFDAHPDVSDHSMGERLTASTPFRRAVEEELLEPKRMVLIGIRGATNSRENLDWASEVGITIITMDDLYELGVDGAIGKVHETVGGHPAYVSFCIDGVDPAFAPGTGVRVPGGFSSYEAIRMVRKLHGLTLVGADIVEFSPPHDIDGLTANLALALTVELIALLVRSLAAKA